MDCILVWGRKAVPFVPLVVAPDGLVEVALVKSEATATAVNSFEFDAMLNSVYRQADTTWWIVTRLTSSVTGAPWRSATP